MLKEILIWWGQQLLSLLPNRLRTPTQRRESASLTLDPAATEIGMTTRRRGRPGPALTAPLTTTGLQQLATAAGPRPHVTELVLPPGRLLEQTVTLPLAAEQDPARVLRYEMDRLTPFSADELFWSWRIQSRDRVRNLLTLVLSLTPKAPLLPVLDALATADLRPDQLRSGTITIKLDSQTASGWQRSVRRGLAAACAVLAIAAIATPFVLQSKQSRATERRIAALRPTIEQAEALRRRAAAASAGIDVLAAQRTESGSVLDLLAVLTVALPDDTALTDLAYRARVATVSGNSATAVRLIALLSADPALRNTAFTAPVTRNDTTRREGFTLRTELAP